MDSRSDGFIERTIQSIEAQIRTMRQAFESRISRKLRTDGPKFAWLAIYAANLINLYEVGHDGKVSYQRLRGRKMHTELVEFGEHVHFMPLNQK